MTLLLPFMLLAAAPAHAATPGLESTVEQSSTATPKEKAQNAAEMAAAIDAAVTTVTKLLETAKNDKPKNEEMIKCLEDKLPQLTTIKDISGRTHTAMKANLASGDMQHADQEYRQLAVLHGRAQELLVAAQQCVKSTTGEPGKQSSSISGGSDAIEQEDVDINFIPETSPT
jgi:hypothetical protein